MWKFVKGMENRYEVSDKGELRNAQTKHVLALDENNIGYKRIKLSKNGFEKPKTYYIHRLVAEAFIDNPDNKPCVNHKDLDRRNNTVENLEWVTYKENEIHSRKYGVVKEYKPFCVTFCDGRTCQYESKEELAIELGLTRASIKMWLHGKTKGYLKRGIISISYV